MPSLQAYPHYLQDGAQLPRRGPATHARGRVRPGPAKVGSLHHRTTVPSADFASIATAANAQGGAATLCPSPPAAMRGASCTCADNPDVPLALSTRYGLAPTQELQLQCTITIPGRRMAQANTKLTQHPSQTSKPALSPKAKQHAQASLLDKTNGSLQAQECR